MSDKKISQLPAASDTDVGSSASYEIPVVVNGTTKKVSNSQVLAPVRQELQSTASQVTQLSSKVGEVYTQFESYTFTSPTASAKINGYMSADGTWNAGSTWCCCIDIRNFRGKHITGTCGSYAFLISFSQTSSTKSVFCEGCSRTSGSLQSTLIPSDANYLYIYFVAGDNPNPMPIYSIDEGNKKEGIGDKVANIEATAVTSETEEEEVDVSLTSSSSIFTKRESTYIGSSGSGTSDTADTYYFIAPSDMTIYVESSFSNTALYRIGVGTGTSITNPSWASGKYASCSPSIVGSHPTSSSPWDVEEGNLVAITVKKNVAFSLRAEYTDTKRVIKDFFIPHSKVIHDEEEQEIKVAWFGDSQSQQGQLPHKVASITGFNVIDCSFGGASIVKAGAFKDDTGAIRNDNFERICEQIVAEDFSSLHTDITAGGDSGKIENLGHLETLDFDDVDVVVAMFGGNELSKQAVSLTQIGSGLSAAYTNIMGKYKHLKVVFITPPWRVAYTGNEANVNRFNLYELRDKILNVCDSFGVPCLNFTAECGVNSANYSHWLNSDNLHPNNDAEEMYSRLIAKWLSSKV